MISVALGLITKGWFNQYERMKEEYKEELVKKKRYLVDRNEEIGMEMDRIRNNKGNVGTNVDQNIEIHMNEIKELKKQIENDEKLINSKDKEIDMKQQLIAEQESSIKEIENKIKDFDNDMDFIEISYQMQKDKADKNEKAKNELIELFEKLKGLVG